MIVSTTRWKTLIPGVHEAELPNGRFSLFLEREDMPIHELCDFALRNNERRRFLFVSRVLGRHWPVRPASLRSVARKLAKKLRLRLADVPTVFFGMAETATTLGQAVFREWQSLGGRGLYIESTRRRTGGSIAFEFAETHSHATAHTIHEPDSTDDPEGWLRNAQQAVIVDDEATTGATANHLAKAWRQARTSPLPAKVTLAVLLHWKIGDCTPHTDLNDTESLVQGRFEFHSDGEFPAAPATQEQLDHLVIARRGPRHGLIHTEKLPEHWQWETAPNQKILVIGNGEFGFQPLLLAEALETLGAEVWVQATTRSPIFPGGAIQHIRSFPALSGEGYTEHLYNVSDDHLYDRVILCLEDELPTETHPIWQVPRLEVQR